MCRILITSSAEVNTHMLANGLAGNWLNVKARKQIPQTPQHHATQTETVLVVYYWRKEHPLYANQRYVNQLPAGQVNKIYIKTAFQGVSIYTRYHGDTGIKRRIQFGYTQSNTGVQGSRAICFQNRTIQGNCKKQVEC